MAGPGVRAVAAPGIEDEKGAHPSRMDALFCWRKAAAGLLCPDLPAE